LAATNKCLALSNKSRTGAKRPTSGEVYQQLSNSGFMILLLKADEATVLLVAYALGSAVRFVSDAVVPCRKTAANDDTTG
jgi:hypothetical protein